MTKVSVVMALYNTPFEYLHKTVESILNQSFTDFEFIIVDDASSIEYEIYFEKFIDERIKYYKLEKNNGPGFARNFGIKQAIGEYIAIADSDDIYLPCRLKSQIEFFDTNADISLIGSAYRFSNKNTISHVLVNNDDIKAYMLFNSALANPTIMFKKEVFINNGLFYPEDISFAEDYQLWVNAMFAGIKMANIDECLMIYTRRAGQMSKAALDYQIKILLKIYNDMFIHLGFEPSKEELELHYDISSEKFKRISSAEQILSWFDKIIEFNTKSQLFDPQLLMNKKEQILFQYNKFNNRLFKIKIGGYNFCLSKNLKPYIDRRD